MQNKRKIITFTSYLVRNSIFTGVVLVLSLSENIDLAGRSPVIMLLKTQRMTKILLTAVVADMRNSMSGTTFSKGRYGNYMKNKAIPVKRDTGYQNKWRSFQAYFSKRWRQLSEVDRTSWVDGSINFPYIDKFGNTMYLSGYDLFIKLNLSQTSIGFLGDIDSCPTPELVPSITFPTFSIAWDPTFELWDLLCDYAPVSDPPLSYVVMYSTQPGSAGQMVMGKTQYLLGIWPYGSDAANAGGYVKLYFGIMQPGQKIFVSYVVVNSVTGQRAAPVVASFIVPPFP